MQIVINYTQQLVLRLSATTREPLSSEREDTIVERQQKIDLKPIKFNCVAVILMKSMCE